MCVVAAGFSDNRSCARLTLAVQDAPDMQYLIRMFLADTPHTMASAFTAVDGLAAMATPDADFDVVLIDLVRRHSRNCHACSPQLTCE
jgi:CheY-like chemotaxis protein